MYRIIVAAFALSWTVSLRAQDSVSVRLNESPRHHEWVKVKSGDRQVDAFLVFPEVILQVWWVAMMSL